jgi:hypothetical protein
LATAILSTLERAAEFTYNYAYDSGDRGVYYDLQYANDGQDGTNSGVMPGTVSVDLSSSTVTGKGTQFLQTFACNSTDFIGIEDGIGNTWTYPVVSCSDDLHLTIAMPWGSQTMTTDSVNQGIGSYAVTFGVNAQQYYETPPAFTDCRNSATRCWPSTGDRNNDRDLIWIQGWLYNVTHDTRYLNRGDELFSASYGGPAGGPGTTGACGGPACDGFETDYMAGIHACAIDPTLPCNDQTNYPAGNAFVYLSKRWAQGSGIGGADNYLAWRLLGTTK